MRLIKAQEEYELIECWREKIVDRIEYLPQNVFQNSYSFFLFITFYEILMPSFFSHIKTFLERNGENGFWLSSLDPDPKTYYGENFGFFGTIEFLDDDTEEDYLAALHNIPVERIADALAYRSDILLLFSRSHDWGIYGVRHLDIAICAFTHRNRKECFQSIYKSDLLNGVDAAAEYVYGGTNDKILKERFRRNYREREGG